MELSPPEPPGQEQQISLLSLDRRMTVMETKFDLDRESRTRFEHGVAAQLATMNGNIVSLRDENTLKKGTIRGIVLVLSFAGSSAGAGVIMLLKHLAAGAS
ncbi:hypothetical protein [Komagataeibacter medellinensis]|uniref:Uncharacterized protein n=1 Tax=Komagataeibacter medellinensis (strain NBRC 3288 / BCRC 11682 / LMG 1693 / Kondo 51) TaxID=634177 RepID=G2I0S6_KOMMN|nr:hypothetical protein [Komagataeibacter medellinensis]BAK83979.1 hypothetical protein GLX_15670 [Komagataeibacter medellinensis NBRC 3288]BAK84534.1 hypothetical protein GLX_21220 [Komagataeibacter medellinensis NBRC 3288]